MNSAAQDAPRKAEFDRFLYTQIGEDQNGLPLSVVSHLARMNFDPWQEAGTLADLPAEAAAKRLAGSFDTVTDPGLRQAISETMVLRLLALLPRRVVATVHLPEPSVDAVAARDHVTRIQTIVFISATIALLVGSQILATHRFAPMQSGVIPGSAVLSAPARILPPPAGP